MGGFKIIKVDSPDGIHKEKIEIYNTYPLFLKLDEDMNNGDFLYFDLREKQWNERYESFSVYVTRINTSLLEFVANVYKNNYYQSSIKVLARKTDFQIETIRWGNYYLIFVRVKDKLIFLNYIKATIESVNTPIESYLIPRGIKNEEYHVQNTFFYGNNYRTINTFAAFIPFAQFNNNSVVNIKLNSKFFEGFRHSLNMNYTLGNINLDGRCEFSIGEFDLKDQKKDGKFKFIVIYDIIIIYEYVDLSQVFGGRYF